MATDPGEEKSGVGGETFGPAPGVRGAHVPKLFLGWIHAHLSERNPSCVTSSENL